MFQLMRTVPPFLAMCLAFPDPVASQATTSQPSPSLEFYRREARSARERKDYGAMLANLREAARGAPTHPRVLLGLAEAQAMTGAKNDAFETIDRLLAMRVFVDVDADADLQGLRSDARFEGIQLKLRELQRLRTGRSEVAASLEERDLLTEGVALDEKTHSLFVSSVHRRKVVRIGLGSGAQRDFVSSGRDGLWGAKGIHVDSTRRLLWVTSMAMPQAEGFSADVRGTTGLFAFDLDSGVLRRKHIVGAPEDQHGFDDLTIDEQGRVFVSDALAGGIWWTSPDGNTLTPFLPAGTFLNPNGLAIGDGGRFLYVSDYPRDAILAVDLTSRAIQPIAHGATLTLYAADGLVAHGNSLLIIQNGVAPYRIARLTLDSSGTSIADFTILEMNNPQWDEPTLGAVIGNDLYYVGVSQWGRFNEETGEPDLKSLRQPLIFRLRLAP